MKLLHNVIKIKYCLFGENGKIFDSAQSLLNQSRNKNYRQKLTLERYVLLSESREATVDILELPQKYSESIKSICFRNQFECRRNYFQRINKSEFLVKMQAISSRAFNLRISIFRGVKKNVNQRSKS